MSLSSIPSHLRHQVRERDGDQCQYCHLRQFGQASTFHVDHIVPRSAGGATTLANLALQCPWCSLRKSSKLSAEDPLTQAVIALFDPLRERWDDHFYLEQDGTCVGKTQIGRATVAALRMNEHLPRSARAMQKLLRLI